MTGVALEPGPPARPLPRRRLLRQRGEARRGQVQPERGQTGSPFEEMTPRHQTPPPKLITTTRHGAHRYVPHYRVCPGITDVRGLSPLDSSSVTEVRSWHIAIGTNRVRNRPLSGHLPTSRSLAGATHRDVWRYSGGLIEPWRRNSSGSCPAQAARQRAPPHRATHQPAERGARWLWRRPASPPETCTQGRVARRCSDQPALGVTVAAEVVTLASFFTSR